MDHLTNTDVLVQHLTKLLKLSKLRESTAKYFGLETSLLPDALDVELAVKKGQRDVFETTA
jgi:hypothetical protein